MEVVDDADDAAGPASPAEELGVDFAEEEEELEEDVGDVPFLEDEDEDAAFEDEIDGLPETDED